ncbi:hypothetical protein CAPTEDRAFT_193676 [Capitella teleta]|uniref:Uncharacterized protein n=1 Tax=Capitella teleta TaxID=283909 RepID=R7TF60_CAPTE|nr:hypothetical protein CAPTEDRAFT_193676 [Capitella teleta]|eukprot:ELT89686.1 hypothetical protein CAPTEDRAFT_193676 [Capitella teleta]
MRVLDYTSKKVKLFSLYIFQFPTLTLVVQGVYAFFYKDIEIGVECAFGMSSMTCKPLIFSLKWRCCRSCVDEATQTANAIHGNCASESDDTLSDSSRKQDQYEIELESSASNKRINASISDD